jgi:hypothetical protein
MENGPTTGQCTRSHGCAQAQEFPSVHGYATLRGEIPAVKIISERRCPRRMDQLHACPHSPAKPPSENERHLHDEKPIV